MKKTRTHPDELIIGLVSISDRASTGVYEDQGVPALRDWFASALTSPWQMETRLIPDEQAVIEKTLIEGGRAAERPLTFIAAAAAGRHARQILDEGTAHG